MCLKVDKKFKTRKEARNFKPLIAKKEIKVYKILDTENTSPYFTFTYDKGYQYSSNFSKYIEENYGWKIKINKGLHSFIDYKNAKERKYCFLYPESFKIITMYIPKGSKYYLGDDGDIVSDNLIWY